MMNQGRKMFLDFLKNTGNSFHISIDKRGNIVYLIGKMFPLSVIHIIGEIFPFVKINFYFLGDTFPVLP